MPHWEARSLDGRTVVRILARARYLLGLVALIPLSSCSGQVISAGDITVLVAERADSGMDALGGGTLEVVGGCLGAGDSVILWPNGTQVVKDSPLTIDVPGNGRFALGDEVQVGGGYVLEHSSRGVEPGEFEAGGVTVPAECARHDIFLAN